MTGCVCDTTQFPGHCDRHGINKAKRWAELCATRQDYFLQYERGEGPGQKAGHGVAVPPGAVIHGTGSMPCVHREGQIGKAPCKPCQNQGVKEVAIYGCHLYGSCTIQNHAAKHHGRYCTACSTCERRVEPTPKPRMPSLIYINADLHGLGDVVTTAWISEGSRNAEDARLVHRATGARADVLTMLGQDVVSEIPAGGREQDAHHANLGTEWKIEAGEVPRHISRGRAMGITVAPKRPPVRIPETSTKWAAEQMPTGEPWILLYPQTVGSDRQWPHGNWLSLLDMLRRAGFQVGTIQGGEHKSYGEWPHWIGPAITDAAALVKRAALVIAHDSYGAHLAGTLDAPCLALLGPTKPTVFELMPSVKPVTARVEDIGCTGCHWHFPRGSHCVHECQSLIRLRPEDVYREAVQAIYGEGIAFDAESGLFTRAGTFGIQDQNVIGEVCRSDCYGINAMEPVYGLQYVVDVGGHIGTFPWMIRRKMPRAKIVTVDAEPRNAWIRRMNVGRIPGLEDYTAAICYREEEIRLASSVFEGGWATGGGTIVSKEDVDVGTWHSGQHKVDETPIQKLTLEDLMERHAMPRIDLLKLDCEGSEFDILENSSAIIDGKVRVVIGEYHGIDRFRILMERFSTDWDVSIGNPAVDGLGYFRLVRK